MSANGQDATKRSVTLAVCDGDGSLLGTTPAFAVPTPWWPDTEPIGARFPQLTVLRLLGGSPAAAGPVGGEVRYLAELDASATAADVRGLRLREGLLHDDDLDDHPLRMPWGRRGGPASDLAWAVEAAGRAGLEQAGRPRQHRTWNLSAIWSLPVRRSDGEEVRLWLKCVPGFFAHEPKVLALLRDESVPRLLAAEGYRMLLAEMPGRDGFGANPDQTKHLVEHLVDLQLRTRPLVAGLLAAGVPDAGGDRLVGTLARLVARRAPDDPVLNALVGAAGERLAEAAECGLPDVLVHGDVHPGNTRLGAGQPILFDWGDSRIGNPVLDLDVLDRLDPGEAAAVAGHWLGCLGGALPGSDPPRAWRLLRPLAALRAGAVYQAFLDNIEPSERIYHEGDVLPALERAGRLALAQRDGAEDGPSSSRSFR